MRCGRPRRGASCNCQIEKFKRARIMTIKVAVNSYHVVYVDSTDNDKDEATTR